MLIVSGCTLSNNTSGAPPVSDGGISATIASSGGIGNFGTLTVIDCTLSGNTATGNGGGIFNGGTGTVSLSNSTLSKNAAARDGGGIFNEGASGSVTVEDSTFKDNAPDNIAGSGGYVDLGGNIFS
jgi:parallel beta-helix repeat protein